MRTARDSAEAGPFDAVETEGSPGLLHGAG